jgi:stage III sporulation protein AD
MMEAMMKLTAVGVTAAVLSAVLKRNTPELAMLLALCAGLWMLALAAEGLGAAMALMRELAGQAGLSEALLEPVVKAVALSILTRLTAEICRSAGEGGVAAFVETAGSALSLMAALPLVRAVAQMMGELLT